jgi:glucoamylase
MPGLADWIAGEARIATRRMLDAVSATRLVMERPGFGQRIVPRPGSILASPVPAHYDPEPDYFFHWFRDSAIVVDALRVALAAGYADRTAVVRLREFLEFTGSLHSLDGNEFLRRSNFRAQVQPAFLSYLRPDEEIAALSGAAVLADVRVNADGMPDVLRWSRPQTDGPATRCLALLRWREQFPRLEQDRTLKSLLAAVIGTDLAFTLDHVQLPSSDIWEEESGYHYYVQLVQAQALIRGADWLEGLGKPDSAGAVRTAGEETLARLDGFWDAAAGWYRSRAPGASLTPRRDLDIAVILAVLHSGRSSGRHSVLDPKVQATLAALEELFETEYPINRERPPGRGPALGRYADDHYYGGGAWYLATLAAAEFYFRLARALRAGAGLAVDANARFRRRLGATTAMPGREESARIAMERGDAIMRTVQAFTPGSGDLSEQFDRSTGAQSSARHLSWSYAAFITAAASREEAAPPIETGTAGIDPPAALDRDRSIAQLRSGLKFEPE